MATSCNICVSAFNKSSRREVTCAQCQFSACRECNSRFILESVNDPACMNCKVPWNNEFIIANFTKKFFNEDLMKHRADMLFENEKALMPATQARIQVANVMQEVMGMRELANVYDRIKRPNDAARYRKMAVDIITENGIDPDNALAGPSSRQRSSAVRPVCGCIRDDCRGFVMNNSWKCGLCATKVCSECLKEEVEGHECTEEDKETRKLLLKNTKPCPKCAAMIFKTEGCSQMWCTMCHTTFDWNSGEIVTGYVHNPHYFEWARRNGHTIARAPGDVPPGACRIEDGLPDHHMFVNAMRTLYRGNPSDLQCALNMYQVTAHMNEITRQDLRTRGNNDVDRENLRTSYLLDEITVDEYKKELVKRARDDEKKAAQWQVAELFITHATEVLRFVFTTRPRNFRCREVLELMELINYCNENFKKIARAYNQASWYKIEVVGYGSCRRTKQ